MKIKQGFVMREVLGKSVVVATGEAGRDFHGMIKLNRTAAEVWKGLEAGKSEAQLSEEFAQRYEVTAEQARADVSALIAQMRDNGFLTDD